jgi:hypothetical protein
VIDGRLDIEQVDAADQFIDAAHPELGHVFAHFLGDVAEEVDRRIPACR